MRNFLPFLFVMALLSTGEATLKIYPFFFVLFVCFYMLSGFKLKRSLVFPVLSFVIVATAFALINIGKSFDLVSQVKLVINLLFLISAGSYLQSISSRKSLSLLRMSSCIFILLSFVQSFLIVATNSLWLLPLGLEDSTSSYAVQESIIYFGEQSKNIWASKISIFFIIFCCCQYLENKRNAIYMVTYACAIFGLVYVNSRTAQLATIFFLLVMVLYHFWFVKKQRFILVLLGVLLLPVLFYTLQKIIRIDYEVLLNFSPEFGAHMGDGLLSRLIIWSHVLNSTELTDYIFGNGVLSFSYYTGGIFVENNPHNIFLSVILDFGVLSFCLYVSMLYSLFRGNVFTRLLFAPFLVFANSQYLGYDSDLAIYFLLLVAMQAYFSKSGLTIVAGKRTASAT